MQFENGHFKGISSMGIFQVIQIKSDIIFTNLKTTDSRRLNVISKLSKKQWGFAVSAIKKYIITFNEIFDHFEKLLRRLEIANQLIRFN